MTTSRFFTTTSFALALAAGAFTGVQAQQTAAPPSTATPSAPATTSDPSAVNPTGAPTASDAQMATPSTAQAPPPAGEQTVDTTTAVGIAPDGAAVIAQSISNSPIPDTPANRAKYGQPLSHAGQQSDPAGN